MLPLCVVSCAQPRSAPSGWPASRTAAVSLTAVAGAACSMDVVGHKYESFVQQELQKRAAAARKEGMQVGMAEAAVHAQEGAGGRGAGCWLVSDKLPIGAGTNAASYERSIWCKCKNQAWLTT